MGSAAARDRWELDRGPVDVLVIGSQLVYGSVGTNGVVPILTAAGLVVARLPTVLLSNLPHHASVHAVPMTAEWITGTLADLDALGITDEIGTVVTGYFVAPEQVEAVATWLSALLARRPTLRVVVDPTLGDSDVGFYTDPAVAGPLRSALVPLATGITPNAFELETLTAESAATDDVPTRARSLLGPRGAWAVVTGGETDSDPAGASGPDEVSSLLVLAHGHDRHAGPRIASSAKGAGDVFTGALVAALHAGQGLDDAVTTAAATVRVALATRSLPPRPGPSPTSSPSDQATSPPTRGRAAGRGDSRGPDGQEGVPCTRCRCSSRPHRSS